jgi:phosphoglycerate-specific signal transduction histidine kinase
LTSLKLQNVALQTRHQEEIYKLQHANDSKVANIRRETIKGVTLLDESNEKLKVAKARVKDFNRLENAYQQLTLDYEQQTSKLELLSVDYALLQKEQKVGTQALRAVKEALSKMTEDAEQLRLDLLACMEERKGVEAVLEKRQHDLAGLQVKYM